MSSSEVTHVSGWLVCQVLPSPGRACPDIEGDGVGLGGKSDIMPCNLFLRFSEPRQEERSTKHPVMQRCRSDGEEGSRTRRGREGGGGSEQSHVHSVKQPTYTSEAFAGGSSDIRAATQAHAHIERGDGSEDVA